MGYLAGPMDTIGFSPLASSSLQNEFLGLQQCHMGFHDPEVFNESADGAAGRIIAGREIKSKTRIHDCSN